MGVSVECVLLSALGGYVVASLILLKFPRLLHKRKTVHFKAAHISHRGGAGENLENTMEAFRHAIKHGTQMLEIDCHLSKDGYVVVSHDNDISRSTGHQLRISDSLYKELPPLKSELKVTFSGGDICRTACLEEDKRQFALLRDVFTEFPHTPVNIDIKVDDDQLIAKVNELVKEFQREQLTIWGSMRNTVCTKLYKINPEVPLFCSIRRVFLLVVQFYTGILPFLPIKESYLEIPMPKALLRVRFSNESLSWKWRFFLKTADFLLMNRCLFAHLQARGIPVLIWVLNDEESFARAFRFRANGVMTDFPTRLEHFLDQHPQYKER